LTGEFAALAYAFIIAVAGALAVVLARSMSALPLNGWRAVVGAVLYILALTALGKWPALFDMSPTALLAFIVGPFLAGVMGGTLFIKSLLRIGASRAMPIAYTYSIYATLMAALLFNEPVSWALALSILLVILGASLIASAEEQGNLADEPSQPRPPTGTPWSGVGMAFGAALLWAAGPIVLRTAVHEADLLAGNFLRMATISSAALLMAGPRASIAELRAQNPKALGLLLASGFILNGLASLLFLFAIQQAGVARTTVLSATTPLFGVLIGLIYLRESITCRQLTGVLLCTLGIVLVVARQ
jgi:drug/metabolite transporter (DMT)-like permease